MRQRDAELLRRIAEEIGFLERLLDEVSPEAFDGDEVLKRASAMSSINIGELSKHLRSI